jgi:hypothetical protein
MLSSIGSISGIRYRVWVKATGSLWAWTLGLVLDMEVKSEEAALHLTPSKVGQDRSALVWVDTWFGHRLLMTMVVVYLVQG